MKAFLDTNVILAAFVTQGVSHGLFQRVVAGEIEAVVSEQVLAETEKHLRRKFHVPDAECARTLALIRGSCEVVPVPPHPPKVSRDPDDDAILAAAIAARATHLVSGDKDLLVLDGTDGVRILPPAEFIRCIESRKKGR